MTTQPTKKAPARPKPTLDFPKRAEKIVAAAYTLRFTVPAEVRRVEVSIDEGPWRACREAVGHWWYDWSGYENGAHAVAARHEAPEGRWVAALPRKITVDIPRQPAD